MGEKSESWAQCRFRPPSSIGLCRTSRASLGEESFSHMKSHIILVMAFSMCLGIPCAFIRNWVCPPTITWIIFALPIMVGFDFPHLPRFLCILSRVISHSAVLLALFPIQAPRDLIASLSFAILILGFSGLASSWSTLHFVRICLLCSLDPIGIISVFSMLNFAPDTLHQSLRMAWAVFSLSSQLRNRLVSSVNKFILIGLLIPGMLKLFMFGSFLIMHANSLIPRLKRRHESGSPWCSLHVILKGSLRKPFIAILVSVLRYIALTVLMKRSGRLKALSVFHR